MADKKVAIVTGGSRGLGVEIARQLAGQGITVILTARDEADAHSVVAQLKNENLDVHAAKLDVTNAADIDALKKLVTEKFGRLDILVNNAGVMEGKNYPSVKDFRAILEANAVGPFAITEAFLPLLEESPAGRIVNQSSVLGSLSMIGKGQGGEYTSPGYCSSKATLNMLTVVYAQLLKNTKIKVNSAHPGWVKTDMGGPNARLEISDGAKTAVRLATLPDDGPSGGFFHVDRALPW